jgi:hypothetical protein
MAQEQSIPQRRIYQIAVTARGPALVISGGTWGRQYSDTAQAARWLRNVATVLDQRNADVQLVLGNHERVVELAGELNSARAGESLWYCTTTGRFFCARAQRQHENNGRAYVWILCPHCDFHGRTVDDSDYDPTQPHPHGAVVLLEEVRA